MQLSSREQKPNSKEIEFVPLTRNLYAEWDRFCLDNSDAWFWHTSAWLEYTLQYRPSLRPNSQSFLYLLEDRVIAVCPLIVESYEYEDSRISEFSYGGDAGPMPVFADNLAGKIRKEAIEKVYSHLNFLAKKLNLGRVSFRSSPPAPSFWRPGIPTINPLTKLGFADISFATQVLDLSLDEELLMRNMRKGHRADINRARKTLRATVFDRDSISREVFERYRMLHHKAAGRVTRPLATFEMMFQWIKEGLAILSCASLQETDVGFALVSVYKDAAYYSSSCEDPEHNHLPIGHILQWEAMRWLKRHAIRRYEIGLQFYGPLLHAEISQKDVNISLFKRGFGGVTVPCWRGEKFYSKSYYRKVATKRLEAYSTFVGEDSSQPAAISEDPKTRSKEVEQD